MLNVLSIVVLLLSGSNIDGKLFSRCELAQELTENHSATIENAKRLVCIAEYTSAYDTSYLEDNSFGIFNITSEACGSKVSGGSCNVTCDLLVDDNIEDDLTCAIKISNSLDYYCKNNADLNFDECELENLNNQISDDEESSTDAPEEIQETDDPLLDFDNFDINDVSGPKPLSVTQRNLIRHLVKRNERNPKSNVKFIFLFV
jgi:C-type lysozyme/alpha-lactalbumin family